MTISMMALDAVGMIAAFRVGRASVRRTRRPSGRSRTPGSTTMRVRPRS